MYVHVLWISFGSPTCENEISIGLCQHPVFFGTASPGIYQGTLTSNDNRSDLPALLLSIIYKLDTV